jgi:enamine deaminase RidA (YjgF/YER057c/UK114 family)
MGRIADRLAELGLEAASVVPPLAAYVPAVAHGGLVWTAGQLPMRDGQLTAAGLVGADVGVEAAADAARQCALNAIAAIGTVADLDDVERIVKVTGFVASAPGFTGQPAVVNGASELLLAVFGDAGRHARSAVGVAALPLGAAVEVEVVAALRSGGR